MIPFLKHLLGGHLCKISFISMYTDFIRIAASNTANDEGTNYDTPRIFNTNL